MKIKNEKLKTVRRKEQPDKTKTEIWDLRLYVAGQNQKALTAINNLKVICEEQMKGNYQIKVIDLLKHPQIARTEQILAIPTLMRKLPLPVRFIIGDLSNTEQVIAGLALR